MSHYRIIMRLQIPRQQHWVCVSSGLNAISSTHCATDSVPYALLVIRPLASLTPCSTILALDKESKDFQACEWAPFFLHLPLSANMILLEAWEEETEGWTRCGINIYKRLLLWLFPPFSQYLSTSQKTQRSWPHSHFAGSWEAPGLSAPELRRKARWHHSRGGDEDTSVTDGDKGWLRSQHRISIADTMITMCNNLCATTIRVNYTSTAGVISWPTLATHCRRYLQYAHNTTATAIKKVNAGTQISNHYPSKHEAEMLLRHRNSTIYAGRALEQEHSQTSNTICRQL